MNMNLLHGLDSAYAPTQQQVQEGKSLGNTWWAYYLPRLPNTDPLNGWTILQVDGVRNGGITPTPICVPAPPHPADPVQTATEYVALAKQYGHNPGISILYNGEHISAIGPVWLPIPGAEPTAIGPQSAIQWGSGTVLGLGVDLNSSTTDFPYTNGLIVDLEANASYTSAWYVQFQNTVKSLGGGQPIVLDPSTKGKRNVGTIYRNGQAGTVGYGACVMVEGAYIWGIRDENDLAAHEAAGVPVVSVSAEMFGRVAQDDKQ